VNARPMRLADIPPVMAIAADVNQAPRWATEAYRRAVDLAAVPARIALVADDPEIGVLGFLVTVLIPPQAELETIVVAKPAQRQGIARRLMALLFADLKERQITEVVLEVRESNLPALALYRAFGFVQTGSRSRYYSEPEEDAILMQRSLMASYRGDPRPF